MELRAKENGNQFAEQAQDRNTVSSRPTRFDPICKGRFVFALDPRTMVQGKNLKQDKQHTLNRLAWQVGPVRGIACMAVADRCCVNILTRIAAVRAALKGVERMVLENHTLHCKWDAIGSDNPTKWR